MIALCNFCSKEAFFWLDCFSPFHFSSLYLSLTHWPYILGWLQLFHLEPYLSYFSYILLLQFHYLPLLGWLATTIRLDSKHLRSQKSTEERFHCWLGTGKSQLKCFLEGFYLSVLQSSSFTTCVLQYGDIKYLLFLAFCSLHLPVLSFSPQC